MFPVRQLAAQLVFFSQCPGLSSSVWLGKPVLVDPTERMLVLFQILWLRYFKVQTNLVQSDYMKGWPADILSVHLVPQLSW